MSIILSMLFGGLVGYLIGSLIGEDEIRETLVDDDAFYGEIVDLQPNTITIKEIDEDGDMMQYRKLESEEGVDDSLEEGDVICAYE